MFQDRRIWCRTHEGGGNGEITEKRLSELKFPKQFIGHVFVLVNYHDTFVKTDRISVHRFMSKYPGELLEKLQILQRADILAHSPCGQMRIEHLEALISIVDELKASGAVFSVKDLAIDGRDIIGLGVKEGPDVGKILDVVFDHYIEEKCDNSKDSLLKEAEAVIRSISV